MAAAVAVLVDDGSGTDFPSPPSFAVTGSGTMGGFPYREFRRDSDGALFVVVRIRGGGTPKRWLVVVWTAATSRAAALSGFSALSSDYGANLLKAWAVTLSADGNTLLVPSLDADGTAIATAVKALWPTAWRVLQATDPQRTLGEPGSDGGPPTGPLLIGSVIA
jgi:hypothetical protein